MVEGLTPSRRASSARVMPLIGPSREANKKWPRLWLSWGREYQHPPRMQRGRDLLFSCAELQRFGARAGLQVSTRLRPTWPYIANQNCGRKGFEETSATSLDFSAKPPRSAEIPFCGNTRAPGL